MISCKACGNDMDMKEVAPGVLEILCSTCIKKADDARHTSQWNLEGLFWDEPIGDSAGWTGKEAYDALTDQIREAT